MTMKILPIEAVREIRQRRYITTRDAEIFEPGDYPVGYFPPLLRDVITDVCLRLGLKPQLVGGSALAAGASAVQAATKVQGPNRQMVGLNLNLMTICIRGGGKTVADGLLFEFLRKYQLLQDQLHEKALKRHRTDIRIHQKYKKAVEKQIDQCIEQGLDFSAHKARLDELEDATPPPPKAENVLIEVATIPAIIETLSSGVAVTTINLPEAGRFFSGKSIGDFATLNDFYDPSFHSSVLRVGRKLTMSNPAVSQNFMIQHAAAKPYIEKTRDMGNIGRTLVCEVSEIPVKVAESDAPIKSLPLLEEELTLHLVHGMAKRRDENFEFDVIKTSLAADLVFDAFFTDLRESIEPGGRFSDVDDAVAKLRANVLKIAGIFHLLERKTGSIDEDTMLSAIHVCSWYLQEFQRLFGRVGQMSEEQTYSKVLEQWLWARFTVVRQMFYVSVAEIRDMGPSSLKGKNRENREMAIRALEKKGIVSVQEIHGKPHLAIDRDYFHVSAIPASVKLLAKDFAYLHKPNGRYGLSSCGLQKVPPPARR